MPSPDVALKTQRLAAERRLEHWLELPLFALAVVWLVLLVVEFVRGLTPTLEFIGTIIWILFVGEFLLRFTIAPKKYVFLRRNAVAAISLALPALRVLRIARVFRLLRTAQIVRGLRLIRLLTSFNRGMSALSATLGRRGFGYAALLTSLVIVLGAAGIYVFEKDASAGGIDSYGTALWWTAMLMTSIGSEYWPRTGEGRVLCFLLSLYALGVFGYLTATIATFFIARDAETEQGGLAGSEQARRLLREIAELRSELLASTAQQGNPPAGKPSDF